MQSQFERELFKTLKSIDGTLKRIEKSMNDEEKQHTTICNAVSHALKGEHEWKNGLTARREIFLTN